MPIRSVSAARPAGVSSYRAPATSLGTGAAGAPRPSAAQPRAVSASGRGAPGAGASGTAPCADAAGFRSVATQPSRSALRLRFERAVRRPVTVDVFQQSAGRRVVGESLVARFTRRSR